MTYETLRERAITGDVFFTASKRLYSRIVRILTRSSVSHTGILSWRTGDDAVRRLFISEFIEGQGYREEYASVYFSKCMVKGCHFYYGRLPNAINPASVYKKLFDNAGKAYDMAGALMSRWFETDNERFFCSEFVAYVHELRRNTSRRAFTPDDIAERCEVFEEVTLN